MNDRSTLQHPTNDNNHNYDEQLSFAAVSAAAEGSGSDGLGLAPLEAFVLKAVAR